MKGATTTKKGGSLKIIIKNGRVDYKFKILSKEQEGRLSCYIPGYNLFFSAKDKEESIEIGKAMLKANLKYYSNTLGWKEFVLYIHKLGFRSPMHNKVMKELLEKKSNNAKLSIDELINPDFRLGDPGVVEATVNEELMAAY